MGGKEIYYEILYHFTQFKSTCGEDGRGLGLGLGGLSD